MVYEQRMSEFREEEQALKVVYDDRTTRGRGRGAIDMYKGIKGR